MDDFKVQGQNYSRKIPGSQNYRVTLLVLGNNYCRESRSGFNNYRSGNNQKYTNSIEDKGNQ